MEAVLVQGAAPPQAGFRADPSGNSLFSSLPVPVLGALAGQVEAVALRRGQRFMPLLLDVPHVYFPVDCLLTIDILRPSGAASQLRVIGSDGMAGGLAMLLGTDLPNISLSVIRSGTSLRVPGKAFRQLLAVSVELRRLVRTYTLVLRGNVERWTALPGNSALGAPLLTQLNSVIARPH